MPPYEEVVVPAGERRNDTVGTNETHENIIYDVTADGAGVSITAAGSDWTIRNIGVRGVNNAPDGVFGIGDTGGGHSVIENVYLGDGIVDVDRSGPAVWVRPDHNGTLDVNRVYVAESNDNAFYGSAPGGNGVVNYNKCYSRDSWVAHYRLARGKVENCVALNTSTRMSGRGVWAWAGGHVEIVNCDLATMDHHYAIVAGANGEAAEVTVAYTDYSPDFHGGYREAHGSTINFWPPNGTDPNGVRIPEGCPTTPEQAVGEDSISTPEHDMDDYEHEIYIEGRMNYRIEVDGEIAPHDDIAEWVNEGEAYENTDDGGWAEWFLTGSHTKWVFNGDITGFELTEYEGERDVQTVDINGTPVNWENLPLERDEDGTPIPVDDGDDEDEPVTDPKLEERVNELELEMTALYDTLKEITMAMDAAEGRLDDKGERLDEHDSRIGAIVDAIRSLAERV